MGKAKGPPAWLSGPQGNELKRLRRSQRNRRASNASQRLALAAGLLRHKDLLPGWDSALLGHGGAVGMVQDGEDVRWWPKAARVLMSSGSVGADRLRSAGAMEHSVRPLTATELTVLEDYRRAWLFANQSGWEWVMLIKGSFVRKQVIDMIFMAPAIVQAAAARDADWRLIVLSKVSTERFFRVCTPGHVTKLREATFPPFRRPAGTRGGWDHVAPTLGLELAVYRRALYEAMLGALERLRPPLNPVDVWTWQVLQEEGGLAHALAPSRTAALSIYPIGQSVPSYEVRLSNKDVLSPGRRAWVTLLTGNSVNYTANVMLQARSVRRFSAHKEHVSMVTPQVNLDTRNRLRRAGSTVREVKPLLWKHMPKQVGEHWRLVFTKVPAAAHDPDDLTLLMARRPLHTPVPTCGSFKRGRCEGTCRSSSSTQTSSSPTLE